MSVPKFSYSLLLLLIPLLAMQFTDDVNWSVFDFIIMGFLLLSFNLGVDILLKKIKNNNAKIFYVALAILLFFLIWAQLAVGVFRF